MEVVSNFLLLGSKITADGDCSHETRKHLLLGRKARQCAEKQRHYYSADKDPYSLGNGLPLVIYGSESWTLKKPDAK